MIKKLIVLAVFVSLNLIPFLAYSDDKPVSFELRFLCDGPSADCEKMINADTREQMYLQKQVQFSITDLAKADSEVQWSSWTQGNEKSLMGGPQKTSEPNAKIKLTFTGEATKRLSQVTADNVNKRLGIILDGKLVMAPNIREPIATGDIEITGGNITKSYAEDFVYRINKTLGVETQEPVTTRSGNKYIGLIALVLGLLVGVGGIKLISMVFPNILFSSSKKSVMDSLVFLFTNLEMQKRLIVTIGALVFVKFISHIPVPGLDTSALKEFMIRMSSLAGHSPSQHTYMPQKVTIMSVGLAPFFTSCVLLQILSGVIFGLKRYYYNEGNGRQALTQHTYILTVLFVAIQAYFIALWLESPATWGGMSIVATPGMAFRLLAMTTITGAVVVLLFLADLINRYGIGNGIALIAVSYLFSKIFNAFAVVLHLIQLGKIEPMVMLILSALVVILAYLAFCLTRYFATVEIQNNKGNKIKIPLRPTIVGKQPLTLAIAVFLFPLTVVSFIHAPSLYHFFRGMEYNSIIYFAVIAVLTIILVYVYAIIVFDLKEIEGSVTKCGYSFTNSAESANSYLDKVMTRVLIWTGIALVSTLVFVRLCMLTLKIPYSTANLFSAGILLVIVGVFSDIISQIGFFKDKAESGIKQWVVCYVAFDEIEATIKSNFLKDKAIPFLVEPLRFTWGLPARTIVDQYRICVPADKKEQVGNLFRKI